MPIREFKCTAKKCKNQEPFEVIIFKEEDEKDVKCPNCDGNEVEKVEISQSSFQLAGGGWTPKHY